MVWYTIALAIGLIALCICFGVKRMHILSIDSVYLWPWTCIKIRFGSYFQNEAQIGSVSIGQIVTGLSILYLQLSQFWFHW